MLRLPRLPALFAAQAAKTPSATAVVFGDERLSYGALEARANRLAHHLRGLGVGPEVVVGLCVERSPEMVVGLIGILKAGGAYLPLDPAYPADRLAFMLADAGAPVLVTQAALLDRLPAHEARVVCLDADVDAIARQPSDGASHSTLDPHHPAYVIYTSGSTGQPKGVVVAHASLADKIVALGPGLRRDARLPLGAPDFLRVRRLDRADIAAADRWRGRGRHQRCGRASNPRSSGSRWRGIA